MVPDELAAAYRDVVAAASLPGVARPEESMREPAISCSRWPPSSVDPVRAEHRSGASSTFAPAALETVAVELRERHTAWQRAVEELDAAVPAPADPVKEAPDPAGTGWLSIVFLVVLAPAFVLVDGARLLVRTGLALLDGLALRLRTVVDLVRHGAVVVGRVITDTLRRWRELSALVMASVRRARRRFVAARALAGSGSSEPRGDRCADPTDDRATDPNGSPVRGGRPGRRASWAPARSSSR